MAVPDLPQLDGFIREAASKFDVVGCAVGIAAGSDELIVCAGVDSIVGRRPVTPTTLFRIGSVAKLFTTTLAMRAVSDGAVAFDSPVRDVIEGFALGDESATEAVQLRHVLAKSDGIFDHIAEFGIGLDCVARYVASLREVGQAFAPGELYSYSNTGAIIAARMLEVIHGQPFDTLLRTRLLEPAGLSHTHHVHDSRDLFAATAEVNGTPLATRHTVGPHGPQLGGIADWPPALATPNAMSPCGTTLVATVGDLMTFAKLHLPGHNPEWLRADVVHEAQELEISLPGLDLAGALGWSVQPSRPWLLTHNGGSRPAGIFARVSILPTKSTAIAVLANTSTGAAFASAIEQYAFDALGLPDADLSALDKSPDLRSCEGTYQRGQATFAVRAQRDELVVEVTPGPHGGHDVRQPGAWTYKPTETCWFRGNAGAVAFTSRDENGSFQYLHDGRAARRLK